MVANITFGTDIPGDAELRLCGDIGDGRRAVELGVSEWYNSIAFATEGAKAIAVDPDPDRIGHLRQRAEASGVIVQCLEAGLADLGDITSGTCSLVLAAQTIHGVEDLGRLLRQVHRVLIPSMPFVISLPHPFADGGADPSSPHGRRTVGGWFAELSRANFRIDQLRELGIGPDHPLPTTLILRARKEGS